MRIAWDADTIDRNSTTSAKRRTTVSIDRIDVDTLDVHHIVGAAEDAALESRPRATARTWCQPPTTMSPVR